MTIFRWLLLIMMIGYSGLSVANKSESHSLEDINQVANSFLADYNQAHKTSWEALAIDQRTLVWQCTAPLKVKWLVEQVPDYIGMYPQVSYLIVICDQTVRPDLDTDWVVYVQTTKPNENYINKGKVL